MPACIFLLPNSLPSPNEIKALGKDAYPPVLRNFLEGFGEPKVATIFENPALSGFASMQWVWMLLTQRENLAPSAPYLWKGLGGPKVHQEFWALNGYRKENGVLKSAGDVFDIDEECDLRDLLNQIARQFNFEVQVLDGRFFLARKKAWQVLITPWLAQEDKPAAQPAGPEAAEWTEITRVIEESLAKSVFNEYRAKAGRPPVEGFWINGGAFEEQLLPYTQIRCALTSDPTIRGISEAAGIARAYIKSSTAVWPDCPEGDRLCILDDFNDPSVKTDPARWSAAWIRAVKRMEHLTATAKGFEKYHPRLVASDGLRVSVIEKLQEQKSSFAFWKSPKNYTEAWLNSGR